MAHIQMNFLSKALMRTVTIQVILPVDKLTTTDTSVSKKTSYPTLYLLNGIMGNHTDWCNATRIQTLAEERDLAVVMPAGENLFYLDYEPIHALYGEYIGQELVEVTRRMFPLSNQREDTFLAGLSMGGYGALRNGLKYADRFGFVAALSCAMELYDIESRTNDSPFFFERRDYAEFVFGDLSKVRQTDKDPVWLAEKLILEGLEPPKVYIACGDQDFLLRNNRRLRDELRTAGLTLTYEEASGGHDWNFWDKQISRVMDWLPLEKNLENRLHSGNIGL